MEAMPISKTVLDRAVRAVRQPGPGSPKGATLSLLAHTAKAYGARRSFDLATTPTGVDPMAAVIFEAIVEAAFLALDGGVSGEEQRQSFRSILATACKEAVSPEGLDALIADVRDTLAEEGLEARLTM